jgi:uncharacterized membrane protein YkvA (DUF1232 family)
MSRKLPTQPNVLLRLIKDAILLVPLIRDYWKGRYRDVSALTMVTLAVAFVYLLNPFDLVSDFLPVIGILDDVFIFGICLFIIEKDLAKYRLWQQAAVDAGREDET